MAENVRSSSEWEWEGTSVPDETSDFLVEVANVAVKQLTISGAEEVCVVM